MSNKIRSIDQAFPGYSYKQTGVFSYDWWKDGNKLGGRQAQAMTLKLNKLLKDVLRTQNEQ